jgi:outer membrane protein assembly factor BamA
MKSAKRQSTGLAVQLGMQDSPPPGGEFDLGFEVPLRAFDPHAFVGTRVAWATFEHRWFAWDNILGLLAIGFAGFADYGGAWYEAQDPRSGGDVGVGIRIGTSMASVPRLARLDLAYRFGDGVGDQRWRVSFGGAFPFGFFRPLSNQ